MAFGHINHVTSLALFNPKMSIGIEKFPFFRKISSGKRLGIVRAYFYIGAMFPALFVLLARGVHVTGSHGSIQACTSCPDTQTDRMQCSACMVLPAFSVLLCDKIEAAMRSTAQNRLLAALPTKKWRGCPAVLPQLGSRDKSPITCWCTCPMSLVRGIHTYMIMHS